MARQPGNSIAMLAAAPARLGLPEREAPGIRQSQKLSQSIKILHQNTIKLIRSVNSYDPPSAGIPLQSVWVERPLNLLTLILTDFSFRSPLWYIPPTKYFHTVKTGMYPVPQSMARTGH